ncbi:MAG: hypothetical protein UT01_C0004G0006 [Candidatus Daviesbacteria bacterium GW2011_GWA1_38_7]|nr:MAG: hypothetical protein UT01_C0004G0006 [Candidatus Daviesbacteria bacterium GW2011_GWA1_38_7]
MDKIFKLSLLLLSLFFLLPVARVEANTNSYVNIVNPVRGSEFWELEKEQPQTVVEGQVEILQKHNLPATFLLRYDALNFEGIIRLLKDRNFLEKGIFLEITPGLTKEADVEYHKSATWHSAGSVFLTGYRQEDRIKLIDTVFNKFKETFGFYPKSVGAWWIDAYSLDYMQKKYDITSGLIVADQYSTDNYQVWGQYWSAPYYPHKRNALYPAQTLDEKIPVVLTQWATRDPVNGYGKAVEESTYSVQANDYIEFHNLGTDYFGKLVDIYTTQKLDPVGNLVVGLENTYSWEKYKREYKSQIELLVGRQKFGQLKIATMAEFAKIYQDLFPLVSPEMVFYSNDPLESNSKSIWFMNPYYRIGITYEKGLLEIKDIRQYVSGTEEICYSKVCDSINFALLATRVLDKVTFGKSLELEEGKINDFKIYKDGEKFVISYQSETGREKKIELLPRDISINGVTKSVDTTIMDATQIAKEKTELVNNPQILNLLSLSQILDILKNLLIFIPVTILAILLPGVVIFTNITKEKSLVAKIFCSFVLGIILFTLFQLLGQLLNIKYHSFAYMIFFVVIFFKGKYYKHFSSIKFKNINFSITAAILIGSIFQTLSVFRSGLNFDFGKGFWGPNAHDGIWHIALINQIAKRVPPENPIFAGVDLKNYHYFYDIFISGLATASRVDPEDLIFRMVPLLFSILLGLGTISLVEKYFVTKSNELSPRFKKRGFEFLSIDNKKLYLISLFFVYFTGSFGWIVDYIKYKSFGGESNFWVNQPVSYNLNPPFMISLLIVIMLVMFVEYFAKSFNNKLFILFTLSAASLVSFKSYAAVLIILSLGILGVIYIFQGKFKFIILSCATAILSLLFIIPNLSSGSFFIVSPLWFVHSMIDSLDRVGWLKLSAARQAYFERKEWFKFSLIEAFTTTVFFVGNLGIRVFGLFKMFLSGNSTNLPVFIFMNSIIVFSLIIPPIVIQKGNPWNSIQFMYYSLFFMAIYAGYFVTLIYSKLPSMIAIIFLIFIIIITPINAITSAKGYLYNRPHSLITTTEMEALEFLKKQEEGVVLGLPFDKDLKEKFSEPHALFMYETTAYISAFSNKPTYLSDEIQNEILQTDYAKRRIEAKDFFSGEGRNREFLIKNDIKYIYLSKIIKFSFDYENEQIKKIFENDEVMIFKVE